MFSLSLYAGMMTDSDLRSATRSPIITLSRASDNRRGGRRDRVVALRAAFPHLPPFVSFVIAFTLFTAGPGAAVTARLTRDSTAWRRVIVALGVGSAVTPVIIDTLGRLGASRVSVHRHGDVRRRLAVAACRADPERAAQRSATSRPASRCLVLTASIGYVVFAHRFTADASGVVLLRRLRLRRSQLLPPRRRNRPTVPPLASYYSGHQLNAA